MDAVNEKLVLFFLFIAVVGWGVTKFFTKNADQEHVPDDDKDSDGDRQ